MQTTWFLDKDCFHPICSFPEETRYLDLGSDKNGRGKELGGEAGDRSVSTMFLTSSCICATGETLVGI